MIENNEEQTELVELLRVYARATLNTEKVQSMRGYLQHGDTTTLDHAIAVAYYSLMLDRKWNLNCDKSSLVRGALLHDYFLYDWHQPHKEYGLHGFTHPFTALRNAVQDFNLNAVERQHHRPSHVSAGADSAAVSGKHDRLSGRQVLFAQRNVQLSALLRAGQAAFHSVNFPSMKRPQGRFSCFG